METNEKLLNSNRSKNLSSEIGDQQTAYFEEGINQVHTTLSGQDTNQMINNIIEKPIFHENQTHTATNLENNKIVVSISPKRGFSRELQPNKTDKYITRNKEKLRSSTNSIKTSKEMFRMSQIQLVPQILQNDSCDQNLLDEKGTSTNKISSFKNSCTSKQNIKASKKSQENELNEDDIKSVTGRKIMKYDWKYGMKHIPVFKTNQLLGMAPFSQQLMSPQNYIKTEGKQEALRLSAKRVNIYHYKPNEMSNQNSSKSKK